MITTLILALAVLQTPPAPRALELTAWWIAPGAVAGDRPVPGELKGAAGLKDRLPADGRLLATAGLRVSPQPSGPPANVTLALSLDPAVDLAIVCRVAEEKGAVTLTQLDLRRKKGDLSTVVAQADRVQLTPGEPAVLASWDGQLLVGRVTASGTAEAPPPPKEPLAWKDWKFQKIAATNDSDQFSVSRDAGALADLATALPEGCGAETSASGGVRFPRIPADGLAALLGFQAGDVVKSMNGIPLRDVEQLAGIAKEDVVKNATALTFGIERGGQMRALVIRFGPKRK